MIKVSPSILAADFANLERDIKKIEKTADMLHIDVMDGHFVPNISIGLPVVKAIKKITNLPLDVHLMIDNPDIFIEDFKNAGSDILTIHYEACTHLNRTVQYITELGMSPFVAINPHTSVELLEDIMPFIDGVLIMSVNPGFGGQKHISTTTNRIIRLKKLSQMLGYDIDISIDGGVNEKNSKQLALAGATMLVAGSAVFNSENPNKVIEDIQKSHVIKG